MPIHLCFCTYTKKVQRTFERMFYKTRVLRTLFEVLYVKSA